MLEDSNERKSTAGSWIAILAAAAWLGGAAAAAQTTGGVAAGELGEVAGGEEREELSAAAREYMADLEPGTVVRFEVRELGDETVLLPDDRPEVTLPVAESAAVELEGWDHLPLQAEVKPMPDGTVALDKPTLQLLADWASARELFPRPLNRALHREYRLLEDAAERLMRSGGMSAVEASVEIERELETTEVELIDSYAAISESTPLDDERRRALVQQIAAVERFGTALSQRKAIYGLDDRYAPATYLKIYQAARAAVGLVLSGDDLPYCSGVLVGSDVVLTARHCLAPDGDPVAADELAVLFDYVAGNEGELVEVIEIFESPVEEERRDFALLLLEEPRMPSESGEPPPVVCLSDERVRLDTPVYAVGHPRRALKMVADNSKVYFPFEVKGYDFHRIQARIEAEFEELTTRAERLKEFKESYRPVLDGAGKPTGRYQYFRQEQWGVQPILGVDTDTFRGNSGSPLFNRRSRAPEVIGLLVSGMTDRPRPWKPGWDAHEGVLPVSEIIDRIDRVLPQLRDHGVCIP